MSATLTAQYNQLMYLHDPEKDDRDLHRDYMVRKPTRNSSKWGPRPYSLAEIIYTNVIPRTRNSVVINVIHKITTTRITRTHTTNF